MHSSPTLISIVKRHIEAFPHRTVLKYKENNVFKDISWKSLGETVELLACGLLQMNVKIGDRIAILSENRPEWVYVDLAILSCGAVTIPIYATDTSKDIGYILNDSGAEIIFVSTQERLQKVLSTARQTPVKRIISFDVVSSLDPLVMGFNDFISFAKERVHIYMSALEERSKAVGSDNLATIIYTSGSTGPPKGVMLTHENFVQNCRSATEAIKIDRKDRYLSFLPLSHVFERMAGYYLFLMQAGEIAYAESRDTIMEDAKMVSPTLMCGVPRFFEKLYAKILNDVIRGPALKRNIFFWGYRVGKSCMVKRLKGKRVPLYLILQRFLITRPIEKKLKACFGGSLRFFISGGAPLSKEVAYFFLSFNILVLEGYGLTESSPVITVNSEDSYKVGTVGRPIPGVSVKIAPDGEILAKGPNIMKGYYKRYKDTETTVEDGWLHTGDVGYLDKDGFLVITDRKKDIIVTSGGKNIAPSEIETLVKADRYIEDILVYGNRKKFLTALVIPDFENLKKYAAFKKIQSKNLEELVKNEKICDFIKQRVDKKLEDVPRFAQIKKIVILHETLTQDHGELTPTLKIKRRVVTDKHKNVLDGLYEKDIK